MEQKTTSDLLRGHTDTIVLSVLLEKDMYGFEIYNTIRMKTEGKYELKEPTLYSSYKRLEREGYLLSYWGDETQGARRKYYQITDLGRALYKKNKRDWECAKKILSSLLKEES